MLRDFEGFSRVLKDFWRNFKDLLGFFEDSFGIL